MRARIPSIYPYLLKGMVDQPNRVWCAASSVAFCTW